MQTGEACDELYFAVTELQHLKVSRYCCMDHASTTSRMTRSKRTCSSPSTCMVNVDVHMDDLCKTAASIVASQQPQIFPGCVHQVLSVDVHPGSDMSDGSSTSTWSPTELLGCLPSITSLRAVRVCTHGLTAHASGPLPSLAGLTGLTALHLVAAGVSAEQLLTRLYPAGLRSLCLSRLPAARGCAVLPEGFAERLGALTALDICAADWQGGLPGRLLSLRIKQDRTQLRVHDEWPLASVAVAPADERMVAALRELSCLRSLTLTGDSRWLAGVRSVGFDPGST